MTEDSVKVCVRVRPLIKREESATAENAEPVQLFWKDDKHSIHQNDDDGNSIKSFSFDRVFTAEETTNQLYQDIAKPLVVSTVEGYNGTIFAYGQTSSGKTFTMMGSEHIPGVIPLAVEDVFQTIKNCPKKEFLLRVSYVEIYNETVTDLLVDSWKRKPLEIRETINKNIYVADLTEELVTSPSQALAWIQKGEKNRHYGKTKMNQRSSRSHTIFRMILESRESDPASGENADGAIIVSHLNLVDLAGSERASQTGAEGTRFKEGCNINRSLFTLGQVIKKLTDESQKGFINYRDSKLTRILQNSLGGNAKTVIICTITPFSLDETLSTLQFASTAKKMKNDPHVTEVSDDGALLKRYRNEIVDLKKRLHEVSSVTQTTVIEKEVLSQLLQEKDHLRREQEDRIRNLTKLLVTSSNLVPVKKMPKRRVTWGGKMLRRARPSTCGNLSDMSLAESFAQKRKADLSSLSELGEEDEFDSQWDIPDEPSYVMEMSQCSVTVQSFGDSPSDFASPDQMHELSGKVSNLELQLEAESQQKEEVMAKVEKLDNIVSELELELQTEVQHKLEAVKKMLETEQRAAEVEQQLQTETQQRLEATEKTEMLAVQVADLQRQLSEQSHANNETQQMRRQFAETIQLCETLASEKDMVVAERDYLKQELGMFIEQTESLVKEKAALSQELVEKKELDEFNCLEEEIRKEHENELQVDISRLEKALESSALQCQGLQNKIEALSEELKKKTEFVEQLQNLSGKDLVQVVENLRRSLDDAEGINRDTKKDWAVLRSQHMALEEMHLTLSGSHEKMEAEVKSLQFQLESERSRYKKMQSDLQKELNVAFVENTKLTALLDGKVPKHVMDSVELESTVANLSKELAAAHEVESSLRAQLEELASIRALPEKVDSLTKQVCGLNEELSAVETQRDSLLTAQTRCHEEGQQLRGSLHTSRGEIQKIQADLDAAAVREGELKQRCADVTQQLDSLRSELQRCAAERSRLTANNEEKSSKLEESEQHRASLEDELKELQQLVKDLEEKLSQEHQCAHAEKGPFPCEQDAAAAEEMKLLLSTVIAERDQLGVSLQQNVQMAAETQALLHCLQDELREQKQNNLDMQKLHEQKELDFTEEMLRLTQELQCVRDEKDARLMTGPQSSADDVEKLLSDLASLSAERDQLKMDIQENVDMMIETQEELRAALEKNREQKEQIKRLKAAQASEQHRSTSELTARLEELQTHVKTLTEELQIVRGERDGLLSQRTTSTQSSTEEMEKLSCRVTCLSEERDQLHEILEGLRQEKNQLKAELEDRMEMAVQDQAGFSQPEIQSSELQACDDSRTHLQQEMEQLQATLQLVSEQKFQMEGDLQRIMDTAAETENHLQSLQEQLEEQKQQNSELKSINQEQKAQLDQQVAETRCLIHSLQEEVQEQKQQNLDLGKLCEQKESDSEQQKKALTQQLESTRAERDVLLFEKRNSCRGSTEELDELQCRVVSLSEERDRLQETLEGLRRENGRLKEELEDRMEMMKCDLHQQLSSEAHSLKEQEAQHILQIQKLEEHLEESREEVNQLKSDLQENVELITQLNTSIQTVSEQKKQLNDELQQNMNMASIAQMFLNSVQEELFKQKINSDLLKQSQETVCSLTEQIQSLSKQLESIKTERDGLLSERGASTRITTEEMQKMQWNMASLSKEKDQLQDTVEGLRQEKDQIKAELEDRMEALQTQMKALTKKLESVEAERDDVLSERRARSQATTEEMEEMQSTVTCLGEDGDQLHETLESLRREKDQLRAEISTIKQKLNEQEQLNMQQQTEREQEAKLRQELLSEANATISSLTEQLSSLQQSTIKVKDTMSSRLHESAGQLEEFFGKFRFFIGRFSKYNAQFLERGLIIGSCNLEQREPMLPSTYSNVGQLQQQYVHTLGHIIEHVTKRAQGYSNLFEELTKTDLAIFEEGRLQDLLLSQTQASKYSDLHTMWEDRLTKLLSKRQLYLQKMDNILVKLLHNMDSVYSELTANFSDGKGFIKQLQPMYGVLANELDQRSAVAPSRKMTLQDITDEHNGLFEELKLLKDQAESQLREERSKNSTLLKALEGAPLKTEVSLLKDNQQLLLQLQQTEEKVKVLHLEKKQLEEAEVKANSRVSNHKQATQLLQTELQDTRAQVEEKANMVQALTSKLQESEKNASLSAVELKKLQDKLFKMEVELSSASDDHQQKIQRMNTVLKEKEDLLRKLKEALRRAQQQGNESFVQGEDLYARLTNPRGLVVESSVRLEKTKLEEEVKRLRLKITELESLVSSQQAEINKWKNRAVNLKVKSKAEVAAPSSLCTPTKRCLPTNFDSTKSSPKKILDSPRKRLDSPKVSFFDSSKSRFFDVGGTSELLSRTCPKQFFDNSSLGRIPDAASGADKMEQPWPLSPKQEEMCKTQ